MATQYLDDSFGPDGIRVTVAVELAVDRYVRERNAWVAPSFVHLRITVPERWRPGSLLPGAGRRSLKRQGWAVMVEADSGKRMRLIRPTEEEAWITAHTVSAAVLQRGVSALEDLH